MAADPKRPTGAEGKVEIDALRVDLAALRRRGVDRHAVAVSLPVAWLADALADTDATVSADGKVSVELLLQPRGVVYLHGRLELGFSVPCGRCLEPAAVGEATKLSATYLPEADAAPGAHDDADDADGDLDPDQTDTFTYRGTHLELTTMVVEQVALAYPMRALCGRGEACRGLCSNCGADLNAQTGLVCAQCSNPVPQTPVADLPEPAEDAQEDAPSTALADALRKLMS